MRHGDKKFGNYKGQARPGKVSITHHDRRKGLRYSTMENNQTVQSGRIIPKTETTCHTVQCRNAAFTSRTSVLHKSRGYCSGVVEDPILPWYEDNTLPRNIGSRLSTDAAAS